MFSILNRYFIITTSLMYRVVASGQDGSVHIPVVYTSEAAISHIRSWDVIKPTTNPNDITIANGLQQSKVTTQYLDGLGRTVQTVLKQGSLPSGGIATDLVTANDYDANERESRQYLPFAAHSILNNTAVNDGLFKRNPFQQQQHFFSDAYNNGVAISPIKGQGESYYYGKKEVEASPLSRLERIYAPGDTWVNSGKGVITKYWVNTLNDDVKIFSVTTSAVIGNFGSISVSSNPYPTGKLSKKVTTDENDKQVILFKDWEGKVILKKVQLSAIADDGTGKDHTGWLCTYYIYDDLGKLHCVIQPEGVKALANPLKANWNLNWNGDMILSEQCFRYKYDPRGRMVVKKLPGAIPIRMVYDKRDRLVMTQDGNLFGAKWFVTIYDDLNRTVATGLWTNSFTFNSHYIQATQSNDYYYPFTLATLPTSGFEILSETYYDTYNWIGLTTGHSFTSTMNGSFSGSYLSASSSNYPFPETPAQTTGTLKELITGSRVKVLNSNPVQYLYTINYYDDNARVIQMQSQNISGGIDIVTTQYSFIGQVLLTVMRHQKGGINAADYIVVTKNNYDALGRVFSIEKKLNSGTFKTISQLEYDALGQVKRKKIAPEYNNNTGLETLNYDYNIRGWLLGANRSDLSANGTSASKFAFELGYDKQTNGASRNYTAAQYNGNIAGMLWKSAGDGLRRKYDFSYDAVNRLMKADFEQNNLGGSWNNNEVNFNIAMGDGSNPLTAYDANGNIKRMQQWGLKGATSTQIDDLTYNYRINAIGEELSNKLYKVNDAFSDPQSKLGDFKDGNNAGDDYSYDDNGNLVVDNNKSISSITYNHLNLPQVITITGKGTIAYTYDAVGTKLNKTVTEPGKPTKTTLYMFGTYENDVLQFLPHEEGRIRFETATAAPCPGLPDRFIYDYMLKDHLGNVRMVLTEGLENKCYPAATVEDARYLTEDDVFDIQNTRRVDIAFTGATQASFEQKLYRTHGGNTGEKTGLGMTLKVMAGDEIKIYAESHYQTIDGDVNTHSNMTLIDFLSAFATSSAIGTIKGSVTGAQVEGLGDNTTILQSLINRTPQTDRAKAYLNWVLFDEQLKVVDVGADPVDDEGYKFHSKFINSPVNVTKNGYLYVFVSNQSNLPVYFDNLTLTHTNGPILEETHYYPFGLTMAGISSKAAGGIKNKRGFNGNELQHNEFSDGEGMEAYDFNARTYDPQLGRFIQVDPKCEHDGQESIAVYHFGLNNPILYNDIDGKSPTPMWAWALRYIARYALKEVAVMAGREAKNFALQLRQAVRDVKSMNAIYKLSPVMRIFDYISKANERLQELKEQKTQAEKSVKSFEENVEEHKEKISEFEKDPIGNSSNEWIRNATKDNPSKETLLERALGRINALKNQLKKNEGELKKAEEKLKKINEDIKKIENPSISNPPGAGSK